jgi:hypothetical protein
MLRPSLAALSLALLSACRSTGPAIVDADPARREALFAPVRALEGSWRVETGEGPPAEVRFQLSSAGSVVRELMFPGTEHEMTNMYSLDGNALLMTHYCAGGNQPRMRATALVGGRLAFESAGVADLEASEDHYMGAMTLVFVDADHVEQHWTSIDTASGERSATIFKLTRLR